MDEKLYYGIDGQRYGPVEPDVIRRMLEEGRLRRDDFLWDEASTSWLPVLEHPAMRSAAGPGWSDPSTGRDSSSGHDASPGGESSAGDESAAAGYGDAEFGHTSRGGQFDSTSRTSATQPGPAVGGEAGYSPPWPGQREDAYEAPIEYAGFWLRVGAHLIDGIVLLLPRLIWQIMALAIVGASMGDLDSMGMLDSGNDDLTSEEFLDNLRLLGITTLGDVFLSWVYYAGLQASTWQATLGKRAMGIVVVDEHGLRCSFGRTTVRFFAKYFLSATFTLGIGFLMVAFTDKKQGLHDLIAGTYCEKT